MREIKFRVWDKIKKLWTNWKSYDGMFYFMDKNTGVWIRDDKFERFILLQYTGEKDKDGKEIYEGDIVKYFDNKEHIVVVENIKELGTGMYLKRVGSGYYTLNTSAIRDYEVEVIGNIHDNPELLEVLWVNI